FRGAARVQKLLEEHRDAVESARQLTPVFDVPDVDANFEKLRPIAPKQSDLDAIFDRLNYGAGRRERWLKALKSLH
ncbi:MAG: hypothetical protein AAF420_06615, partial [Pseudomonadota bacterium]